MKRYNKNSTIYILVIILLGITLGYAYLNTELDINGTTNITSANWSIYWDNIQFGSNNVTDITTPATISSGLTEVTFNVNFKEPGDTYEFTVDAVNDGSINAMISVVSNGVYASNGTTPKTLPDYLEYTVTYSDGIAIAENHLLASGSTETYKVRVHYKEDITSTQLPSTNDNYVFKFSIDYVQANNSAISRNTGFKLKIGNTELKNQSDLSTFYGETTNFESVENVQWQLFYDDNEYIYLIASEPVSASVLPDELVISQYGQYEEFYVSFNSNAIKYTERWFYGEKSPVFQENPLTERYLKWVDPNRDIGDSTELSADITAYMMDMEVWEDFAGDINGAFAMGGPTIEMFALSYNKKHSLKMGTYETINSVNSNEFGYLVKLGDGPWEARISPLEGVFGDMWNSTGNITNYWISSPSSEVNGLLVYDNEMMIIINDVYSDFAGIRPIVAIPRSSL